jgi:anthranilate synthase component 1
MLNYLPTIETIFSHFAGLGVMQFASFEQFSQCAQNASLVAFNTGLNFDAESPASLAARFIDRDYVYVLESASAGASTPARFSFVGVGANIRFWEDAGRLKERAFADAEVDHKSAALLETFSKAFGRWTCKQVNQGSTFYREPDIPSMLGATGYLSFETTYQLEQQCGTPPTKRIGIPTLMFFIPKYFLIFDHLRHRLSVSVIVDARDKSDAALRHAYHDAHSELGTLVSSLSQSHPMPKMKVLDQPLDWQRVTPSFPEADFLRCAETCLEDIRAGEIFQIQIGNRVSVKTDARPFDVFRHLRILNPSPYMFFYKFGKHHILGASPELMVNVEGRRVVHRPIAGTRRRVWDTAKDAVAVSELKTSEKERAEHVMLVDLGRNDIGRIATAGSVRVEDLMVVESYSHVFHMVSQVAGELRPDVDSFGAMAASFPNGTVAGAPKIRAVQLIAKYEPCAREFYAGSLGVFTFTGDLKSTILIRTIHMADGVASTQASAGIVYDSIPAHEWLETKNKMAACLTAMLNTKSE